MSGVSPRTHLYRLFALLVVALIGFLFVKQWATPDSWNYENWYRGAAVEEITHLPQIYGGNESCRECHEEATEELLEFGHKALSCESCHGALADHVTDGAKIADAVVVDDSRSQYLNCHAALISRPKDFPQFRAELSHELMDEETVCSNCHLAHIPGF